MGFKELRDWYQAKPLANALGNAAGIYIGLKGLAYGAEKILDADGLADALSVFSPLISGAYALNRAKEIKSEFLQNFTKVGIASAMGGALGSSIDSLVGETFWSESLKGAYSQANDLLSKFSGTESSGANGIILGAVPSLIAVLKKYFPGKKD